MSNEIKGGDTLELSSDINVITAEINAYQRVAGEAIFEIGRRLKGVRDNPKEYGFEGYRDWERWCIDELGITRNYANRFVKVFEELGATSHREIGLNVLYEIATLPPEQREAEHVTEKGETKKPEDMTVRELRELKKALKASEQAKEQAERQADIERKQRERLEEEVEHLSEREPEIRYETKTEYIEVGVEEPYNRMNDEPFSVERGNEFYSMMREIDELYKKYAHLKDSVEELRGIATYDDDMKLKYRKADEFWRMIGNIFRESNTNIIDVEII